MSDVSPASTRAQTRANYDRLSRWYDLIAGSAERAFSERGVDQLAVEPHERVLEIGPGTGSMLTRLSQRLGPGGVAWGVDLSPGMCRIARRRLVHSDMINAAGVICGDAVALPFPAGALDAVFMSFSLELFGSPDLACVLDECRRVLRPEGRLGVVALVENERPNLITRLYGWTHRRFPAVVDCHPIPLTRLITGHGFRVTAVTYGALWGLPVEMMAATKRNTP